MSDVVLRVYDLSRGMAAQLSLAILGKQIDGIWHTGVYVFGREYFFGGGIQTMEPTEVVQRYAMEPVRVIAMGKTDITETRFHAFLHEIRARYTEQTYDLLTHNCNNFSDEIVKFLLHGSGIPRDILDLPHQVLSTPMGAMLRPMLEDVQRQMRLNGSQIPFTAAANEKAITEPASKGVGKRKFIYSGNPQLYLPQILGRIQELNEKQMVLSADEMQTLQDVQKSSETSLSQTHPTEFMEALSRSWTMLLKLMRSQDQNSQWIFPKLCLLRALLLFPVNDTKNLMECLECFFTLIESSVKVGSTCFSSHTEEIAVLSVLLNSFINPAITEFTITHANQFLPFVFRAMSTMDNHLEVRIMSSKVVQNCCLALELEEEMIVSTLVCGSIEVMGTMSQSDHESASHPSQEMMIESLMNGIIHLLSSFRLARNLSMQLGLESILQRLQPTQSISGLVREIRAIVSRHGSTDMEHSK